MYVTIRKPYRRKARAAERIMYTKMMAQKLCSGPKATMHATEKAAKRYFTSLPFHPHCLNLRANMGSSHTSNQLDKHIITSTTGSMYEGLVSQLAWVESSEPQNRALAGVGKPMNEVV